MLRIIKSIVTIVAVAAIATTATGAYFSDTETSTGNTFTTGTLDLKVGNMDDPVTVHIVKASQKPSASFSQNIGGQFVVKNAGSIAGTVQATIKNIKSYENGCLDSEVGDATCGAGVDQGELDKGLINRVFFSLNQAPWGSLTPSFTSLQAAQGVTVTSSKYDLAPGESKNAMLSLYWDTSANDNLGQGDSVEFDIEFNLVQI